MPDLNPANAQFAWWWEDLEGVPGRGTRHDLEFAGETAANNALVLERTAITRAGMTPQGMPGKLEGSAELTVDAFNPLADWFYLASLFGACSTTEPEADAFQHRFSLAEDETVFPATFTLGFDRDDGMPERFPYGRMSQLAFTFAERALVGLKATAVVVGGDYWADAERDAGAGTAFPSVRGFIAEQFGEDATQNLGVDIVSSTSTTVTFKAKLGDAAAFSGANQVATRGVWFRFADEGGVLQGTLGMPGEIYFPVAGTFDAADVFTIPRRMESWVASLPDSIAVNEVYSVLNVDGVEEEMESMNLTILRPAEARFGFGRQRGRRTRRRGQQKVSGSLNREALSLDMRRRLEMAETFAIEVYLRTGVAIGTTGNLDHSLRLRMAACRPSGPTPTVDNQTTYNEAINFTAHPSGDGTDPEDIAAYLINDIEDLAAA